MEVNVAPDMANVIMPEPTGAEALEIVVAATTRTAEVPYMVEEPLEEEPETGDDSARDGLVPGRSRGPP